MSISDLKDALRHIPGIQALTMRYGQSGQQILEMGGKSVVVGPNASTEEIERALTTPIPVVSYPIRPRTQTPEAPMATIAEQLKAARAKLAEARQGATDAIAKSDDASRVVLGEVAKVIKEADDLRAEVAELTNGGPA